MVCRLAANYSVAIVFLDLLRSSFGLWTRYDSLSFSGGCFSTGAKGTDPKRLISALKLRGSACKPPQRTLREEPSLSSACHCLGSGAVSSLSVSA